MSSIPIVCPIFFPCILLFHWQENVKYLPGVKLGKNVVADPDLENAGNNLFFFLLILFSAFYTLMNQIFK